MKGTRPDLAVSVARIMWRYDDWTAYCDSIHEGVYGYLEATQYVGVTYDAQCNEEGLMMVGGYFDADHGGPDDTTKSTSGLDVPLLGPTSKYLLVGGCKLRMATAQSTPDAEMVAGCDHLTRRRAPVRTVFENVTSRELAPLGRGDRETMLGNVLKGFSRKPFYLAKYQRISVGMMHDFWALPLNKLRKVSAGKNRAGILTKPLDHILH